MSVAAGQLTRVLTEVAPMIVPTGTVKRSGVFATGGHTSMARTASTIFPVTVLPVVAGSGLPVASSRAFRAVGLASNVALLLPTSAAVPVTCGVAIEVPARNA